jgi:hypothetical protein
MLRHQTVLPGRRFLPVLAVAAVLGSGCASAPSADAPAPAARSTAPADAAPSGPQTVTEALGDLPEGGIATVLTDAGPALNPGAPRSYVVKRGDTLWGLAQMFLRDPWLWPEIWYVNPQVQNPHLIYPGDTLQLAVARDGRTALQLTRGPAARLQPLLRSTALGDDGPIATIPYGAIRAFLTRPGIISVKEAKAAPYIYAVRDGHVMAGTDNDVYLHQFTGAVGERYSVMHIDAPLRDPDGGAKLGNMAIYAGTALVKRAGADGTATITEVAREVLPGDVLVNAVAEDLRSIHPHAPARSLNGRVIAISNGVTLAGQYNVVALNRGTRHGIEIGHVLRALEATQTAKDTCAHVDGRATCRKLRNARLPAEDAGTLLVFRAFDRMSYALVVTGASPIRVGDIVRNP